MIANKCPHIEVTVADLNSQRIEAWNSDHLPIYEPGLLEVLKPARDGVGHKRVSNLFFSTDVKGAIAAADLIFLCVPTPTKTTGSGAGKAADMVFVESATRMIAEVAVNDKIIVEKSTVPCRTADSIRQSLAAVGEPGVGFDILSNPEFLAEGTAIHDLLEPDRILIGSLATDRGLSAAGALMDVYANWVPRCRIITMNLWSAEMAKLAANALLAQRISSINSLSAVCEATGADIDEVSFACGLDNRIGPRMLKSSVGFGGSCFKKDILSLVYISESLHLPEVAAYWKSVVEINEYQKDRFIKRIVNCLFQTLTNKKVAILGYAYKKDTGDTRESAAISIVNKLVIENAEVSVYDPKVEEEQIWQSLRETCCNIETMQRRVTVCSTVYEACEGAHAVVIATEWDEFSNKTVNENRHIDKSGEGSATNTTPATSTSSTNVSPNSPLANISSRSSLHESPVEDTVFLDLRKSDVASNSSEPVRQTNGETCNGQLVSVGAKLGVIVHKEEEKNVRRLDWSRVAAVMKRPMFVFDGRNVVDAVKLGQLGFRVERIGKAGSEHLRS